MFIRYALSSEADALTRIAVAAKSYWRYSAVQIELWRNELTFTADSIEKHATFVAEVDDIVVGVVQLNSTTEPWGLKALWLHPDFVGCGIGKSLLGEALAIARTRGQGALAIDADPNAEAFYVSRGATRVGVRCAPILGQENRVRPKLIIGTRAATAASPSVAGEGRGSAGKPNSALHTDKFHRLARSSCAVAPVREPVKLAGELGR